MKISIRIVTLSLALGLTGALASAWGAESVMDLISHGESIMANVKSTKAALDNLAQKNTALVAQHTQLQAENTKLQADIDAFKQAMATYNQKLSDYNSQCKSPTSEEQYKTCKTENSNLQRESESIRSQSATLTAHQKTYLAAATANYQQGKSLPDEFKTADTNYRNAVSYQYAWLDKARDQVASPAFQPYAKKYNCPNVMKPAKTLDQANIMSDQILACFKRVVNSNN